MKTNLIYLNRGKGEKGEPGFIGPKGIAGKCFLFFIDQSIIKKFISNHNDEYLPILNIIFIQIFLIKKIIFYYIE